MNVKHTALPLILALAIGGCSNTPQYYPNFKACYNDTNDANKCLQYIDENGNTGFQNTNTTDPSYNQPMNTSTSSSEDGFDGSSALVGAAAGAAAGYGLANVNNNRKRKEDGTYIVPPSNGNDTSRTRNNNSVAAAGATTGAATSKTTSKPSSKSSTTRGGFGSTGSKSFGG